MAKDLKAMWPGKAIFTDAFLRTLPHAPRATTLRSNTLVQQGRQVGKSYAQRIRRGATVAYTPGPAKHKPGIRGANWTNYMVATVLAHTDTAAAEQAHRQSGLYQDKRLDFGWMFNKQYITKVTS